MQIEAVTPSPAVSGAAAAAGPANGGGAGAATSAFGLSFESLMRIVLTQLTYQDPLKPMENFEFVSQLAQFSQIQLGQTSNDRLTQLVSAEGNSHAAALLGRTVDIPAGNGVVSGKVSAITFQNGDARVTVETQDGRTLPNVSIGTITQIRTGG
jgi:flagellar basal-body rod modification protein FlgD